VTGKPNIVFIFADEMRMHDAGYAGNGDVQTPVLDALAAESTVVTHAVSGCSVCCPYRASLLTGQYPITHGVYINDVELDPNCDSIARAFGRGNYQTAYIGKWHVYGSPDGKYGRRKSFVPRDSQLGFDYWKAFECTHDYNDSWYFLNDDPTPRQWEGYDAFAQSRDAADYIRSRSGQEHPFMMMMSWGPPHFPLHTAPQEYQDRFADADITLRPNVPPDHQESARKDLRGNYAHIAALDDCLAIVLDAIEESGEKDNTIVVFTSDHGDMFHSQGLVHKCKPWDESIRVPFVIRYPDGMKDKGQELALPIDAPDIMPTLLGLCDLPIPSTVQGRDFSSILLGSEELAGDEAALLSLPASFSDMRRYGFKSYRGLRSQRYTYVRDSKGPWLLYDNETDPYQMRNVVDQKEHAAIQADLEAELQRRLDALGDDFQDGEVYLKRDGLTHYNEGRAGPGKTWQDPWASK
jgi:arylsulfatase A-like enzyme